MKPKCECCGNETENRCSVCHRRYCSIECMIKEKKLHKSMCKSVSGLGNVAKDIFTQEQLDKKYRIPLYKDKKVMAWPWPEIASISKNIHDASSEEMKDFVKELTSFDSYEEANNKTSFPKYWILANEYVPIMRAIPQDVQLKIFIQNFSSQFPKVNNQKEQEKEGSNENNNK